MRAGRQFSLRVGEMQDKPFWKLMLCQSVWAIIFVVELIWCYVRFVG